jgi:hypothetical protein
VTVFEATRHRVGKRQTKLYLTEEAYEKLRDTSSRTGLPMSSVAETLILDHCVVRETEVARGDFNLE